MQTLVKQFKPIKRTIFIKYHGNIYSYFLKFPEIRIYKDDYCDYYCYFVKDDKFYVSALFNCGCNGYICLGEDKNLDIFDSYFTFGYSDCIHLYCIENKIKDYLQFLSRWQKEGLFFKLIEIKKEDYAKISKAV